MTLAVDAGGTYIRANLYKNGSLKNSFKVKSAEVGLVKWLEEILDTHKEIEKISISYAGQIKDGVILSAPNIEVDLADIKTYFEDRYGVVLFIQNDLNCAVLAEADEFGCDDVCAIYVGTGLGLGVISGGKLISGSDGVATELGHMPYKESPFVCGCGKKNCIELFASGNALTLYKKHHKLDENLTLNELKNIDTSVYTEFKKALLHATATTITLFNPKVLVLGGGIITNNPWLVEMIKDEIKNYAMEVSLKNLQIYHTKLKDAPLKGALLLK